MLAVCAEVDVVIAMFCLPAEALLDTTALPPAASFPLKRPAESSEPCPTLFPL